MAHLVHTACRARLPCKRSVLQCCCVSWWQFFLASFVPGRCQAAAVPRRGGGVAVLQQVCIWLGGGESARGGQWRRWEGGLVYTDAGDRLWHGWCRISAIGYRYYFVISSLGFWEFSFVDCWRWDEREGGGGMLHSVYVCYCIFGASGC